MECRLQVLVSLLVLGLQPSVWCADAPWGGLIGFLQTFAKVTVSDNHDVETSCCEDQTSLRTIIYDVEDQVLPGDDPTQFSKPRIIYDSANKKLSNLSFGAGNNANVTALVRNDRSIDPVKDGSDSNNNGGNNTAVNVHDVEKNKSSKMEKYRQDVKIVGEPSGRDVAYHHSRPHFIGRKLWYVPLWFSVYFILYLTALVVKSIARHRIRYPALVPEGDPGVGRRRGKKGTGARRVSGYNYKNRRQ